MDDLWIPILRILSVIGKVADLILLRERNDCKDGRTTRSTKGSEPNPEYQDLGDLFDTKPEAQRNYQ